MNDIKSALAQLRAARTMDEQPAVTAPEPIAANTAAPEPVSGSAADLNTPVTAEQETGSRSEVKTLAGRVPLSLHRELTRALLDAADELRFSRINVDEALEAAVKVVLREPQATALWYAQLREVRKERREG